MNSFIRDFLLFLMNTAIAVGVVYAFAKIVLHY
jgi:hypothetical protein